MYCHNCGAEIENGAKNCRACGFVLNIREEAISHTYVVQGRDKSVGAGILIAFLLLGGGHLYAGKITRGLLIMVSGIGIALIAMLLSMMNGVVAIFSIAAFVGYIALYVWSLYDAKSYLDNYNAGLRRFGTPPW